MPAFTFEKIPSPLARAQNALIEKEQPRSVMVRILDRFGRSRSKPGANEGTASSEQTPKS